MKMCFPTTILLLSSLAACGADSVASPSDVATTESDAEVTATETSSPDTSDVFDTTEPVGCTPETAAQKGCNSIEWGSNADYPRASDHHTTLIHTSTAGTYLYVFGGVTNRDELEIFADVRRAKIEDGGVLGAWEDEADLPLPTGFHGQAVDGDHVWLLAGVTPGTGGPAGSNAALFGTFGGDGHIKFAATTALPPEVRVHPTAHYSDGRVYLVGGSAQTPIATTTYAEVEADGSLGTWQPGPDLPTARSHHAGVVHDGRIYLFGGFDADHEPLGDILRSVHAADGTLTGWEVAGALDDAPWTHAATLYEDGVFLVGGGHGGPGDEHYIDRIQWARFEADGKVGAFIDVMQPLPMARSHVHQAPIHAGNIYSVGGRRESNLFSIANSFVGYLAF